jgi:hypothetical protein
MTWCKKMAVAALLAWQGVHGGSQAFAQALDGNALRDLALRGTWLAQEHWGYWSWSDNNLVCLRFFGPDDACADTGVWTINGDALCYEFTWWGESLDVRKNCFTVQSKGGFHYESHYHGGALDSPFFSFIVIR